MNILLNHTSNLGDFLNSLPVISGLVKNYGKVNLVISHRMKKFKGILEFLEFQELFNEVDYDNEVFLAGDIILMHSWTREDKSDINRPTETCRYENFIKDNYKNIYFEVDDDFVIKVPKTMDIQIDDSQYYVGDRWLHIETDNRRASETLKFLTKRNFNFIDYNNSLLENSYILKNIKKPFITSLTGISVLADLLLVEQFVVWKPEDWAQEFRNGEDINWDNGKNIDKIYQKHFYSNRKTKMIKEKDLESLL